MEMKKMTGIALPITSSDSSQVGHARRKAVAMASAMGFSELRQGQLGIVVTEAAGNIATHAQQGEIVLNPWRFQGESGIDVLALDRGKGIADIGRSLEDGFSTAGTLGQGLGAMSRLSAALQIYSAPGRGTALFARVTAEAATSDSTPDRYAVGAFSLAMNG